MLTDKVKDSLYKAVEKYKYEIHKVADVKDDVARIVGIAKSLGFVTEDRSENGLKELILLYGGQWYLSFWVRSGEDEINVTLNEFELLTGQALKDYTEQSRAEANAEMEADRKMSLYNSGYRDF